MAVASSTACPEPLEAQEDQFRRGDSNRDARVDISDPIFTLGFLFQGTTAPLCLDAADGDDNGRLDITDPIVTLSFLFQGGNVLPDPGPFFCGPDPTPDGLGCTSYPQCEVDCGRRPTADAGPDRLVPRGATIKLDGGRSSDPEGQPLTFAWQLLAKPTGSAAALSGATSSAPTLTADRPGEYSFQLIASDCGGSSEPDVVTIRVEDEAPIADAGPDLLAPLGQATELAGGGSDPEGGSLTFLWSVAERPAGSAPHLADAGSAAAAFTPDRAGKYTLLLTVTDEAGGSASDTAVVTAGRAPRITSTPPTRATVGRLYSYDVEADDPDAGETATFTLERAPRGLSIDAKTGLIAWTPIPAQVGGHRVKVVARDPSGFTAVQEFTVQVVLLSAPAAADDEYSVRIGETLQVPPSGVLANDTDADGDRLTARLVMGPANGTLALAEDGSFTYVTDTIVTGSTVPTEETNLVGLPGVVASASSASKYSQDFGLEDSAVDGSLFTSWLSNNFAAKPDFFEVSFPRDVTVSRIQVFGHRDPAVIRATNAFLKKGLFQLFDAAGAVLFDSGPVDLTPPSFDITVEVPRVGGVRRVRVTNVGTEHNACFAEILVIGRTVVERTAVPADVNLCQLLAVTARASSHLPARPIELAVDGLVSVPWFADGNDFLAGGGAPFYEIEFPLDVTVTSIVGFTPGQRPDGFGGTIQHDCRGIFELLDAGGAVRFDSGEIAQPSGVLQFASSFTVDVPSVAGIRRVRYRLTADCTNAPLGFADIQVFGTPSVPIDRLHLVQKFQALPERNVHSTPLVVQLTDDNGDGRIDRNDVPDIVVPVEDPDSNDLGSLAAVSGDDGRVLFTAGTGLVSPWSDAAAADIDGDGKVEIVTAHANGRQLIAFEHTGAVKWLSDVRRLPGRFCAGRNLDGICTFFVGGAVSIANLDGEGPPEIVVGSSVYDNEGHLLGDGRDLGGTTGGGPDAGTSSDGTELRSAISAVSDIDLDGVPEIVAGPSAYRLTDRKLTLLWHRADRPDGFAAIANLDDDPQAEIVLVGSTGVYVLNHDGSDFELWNPPTHAPVPLPGGGAGGNGLAGGAPTISDFDGDGVPEIGVAGAGAYTVFERDGSIRWRSATTDYSSAATGSTTFDFDRDGSVEVVYRDERFLRIYRGSDGFLLAKVPVRSSTWVEEPVVADVDGDGHAEILVTSDPRPTDDVAARGIRVFEDAADDWGRTRRVWNQHAYHVTNVDEDGAVPLVEKPHWLVPGLDSFRTNAYPPGPDGADSFTYRASDGAADSNMATVRIAVRPKDSSPEIRSAPPELAAVGVPYVYRAVAIDPDVEDVLTFSLPIAPAGMSIGAASGRIDWTPVAAQLGPHDVTVKARDAQGLFALQPFRVTVLQAATVPDVLGQPQANAGAALVAAGFAAGAAALQNSLTVAAGRVISQSPAGGSKAVPGSAVDLVVSLGPPPADRDDDGDGFTENGGDCDDTSASVHPGAVEVPGNGIDEDCDGTDPPDPRLVDHDGDGLSEARGDCDDTKASVRPGAAEVPGDGIDQDCNGADAVAGDVTPPTAVIESPGDDSVITVPVEIRGTATDDHFLRYALEVAPAGSSDLVRIATGTSPVAGGVLGTFDPTLLENGLYRVVLFVEDRNGQVEADERVYRVSGDAKVGVFNVSFVDLQVPVSGIPITVVRSYDSRVKERRDFGVGWSLEVKTARFRHNVTPGLGWSIVKAPGPFGLPCRVINEPRAHLTEVRLSDRESYLFQAKLAGVAATGGGCVATVQYDLVEGTFPGATLEVLGPRDVIYTAGGALSVFDGGQDTGLVFDPRQVRLTTIDGRVIDLDLSAGVTRIEDPNGNRLTIAPDAIEHGAGKSIALERDVLGRIRRIVDPLGHALEYRYDAHGDLIEFIDQEGNVTTFSYDAEHHLIEIRDPLGNRAARCEYDAEGRLVSVIDAKGRRVELSHDVEGRQEVLTDARGNVRRLSYDDLGHVVTEESAVEIEGTQRTALSTYQHDSSGNELVEVDPDGVRTEWTYAQGLQTEQTIDPAGLRLRETIAYDGRSHPIAAANAASETTSFAYDFLGNLTGITDPSGNATRVETGAGGLPTLLVDPDGNETRTAYDSAGNVLREEHVGSGGELLSRTESTYDPNGNRLTDTVYRTVDGQLRGFTTAYTYDALNQVETVTDAAGNVSRTEHDARGLVSATVDALGRRTGHTYDEVGALVRTDFPDGTSETREYDASGNLVRVVDAAGAATDLEYDELDREVLRTLPGGGTRRTVYSPGGRIQAIVDADGTRTEFTYDSAGRPAARRLPEVFDAAQGALRRPEVVREKDAAGRVVATVDGNGNRTAYTYDAGGRRVRTTYPDASTVEEAHDKRGRVVERRDEAGRTTRFAYDGLGRLASVTDALGGVTRFAYDEAGNLVGRTDARGHTTRFAYDALNRLVERTLPGGERETFSYDAVGNLLSHTDPNGAAVMYRYDAMDRLVEKGFPDGSVVTFAYTATGLRSAAVDSRGTTSYEYDSRRRLRRAVHPGGEVIEYDYNDDGKLARTTSPAGSVSYHYDALDRLTRVEAPAGEFTYLYDAAGNVLEATAPNGVVSRRSYDSRNRLRQVKHTLAGATLASFDYDLSPTGRRLRVVEADGSKEVYAYDALDRLLSEARTGSSPRTISYEYDAVGNRTRLLKGAAETTSSYDASDRLLAAGGTTYTYDANGNLLSRTAAGGTSTFSWDVENRLLGASGPAGDVQFTYDADGDLVGRRDAAGDVRFLVDGSSPTRVSQVLEERDAAGGLLAHHTYGRQLLAMARGGDRSFPLTDGLGSTRMVTDPSGAVTDSYGYEGYGKQSAAAGSTAIPHRFAGERLDPALGLYHLRARWMDPEDGRFISRDPFPGLAHDPQSLHRYLYAEDDPVNRVDPTGYLTLAEVANVLSIIGNLSSRAIGILNTLERARSIIDIIQAVMTLGQALVGGPAGIFDDAIFRIDVDDTLSHLANLDLEEGALALERNLVRILETALGPWESFLLHELVSSRSLQGVCLFLPSPFHFQAIGRRAPWRLGGRLDLYFVLGGGGTARLIGTGLVLRPPRERFHQIWRMEYGTHGPVPGAVDAWHDADRPEFRFIVLKP